MKVGSWLKLSKISQNCHEDDINPSTRLTTRLLRRCSRRRWRRCRVRRAVIWSPGGAFVSSHGREPVVKGGMCCGALQGPGPKGPAPKGRMINIIAGFSRPVGARYGWARRASTGLRPWLLSCALRAVHCPDGCLTFAGYSTFDTLF